MIIDTIDPSGDELQLSDVYSDGFAWTIVYEVEDGIVEFADEGFYTTAEAAFTRMQEMRNTGDWTELFLVAVKAYSPCGINATE